MPYIGKQPKAGAFKKLDAISVVNGQAAYTLNYNSVAYKAATANALLVSVNGVIQAAGTAYTISGSTITFTQNLVTGDVIDFIIALGDTGSAVTPVDGSVTKPKMGTTELDLSTIKDSAGNNTAMTIDSSGRILQPTKPIFRVVKRSSSGSGGRSGDLDFNEAPINVGGHWDTTNHYFVAPIAGHYQFSFVGFGSDSDGTQRTSGSIVAVGLFKYTGGAWVDETEMYQKVQADNWVNSSFTHITHLAVNERIKVNVRIGYVYYDDSTRDYIVFSGHLIG